MGPSVCVACLGVNWVIYSVATGESLSVAGLVLAGIVPAILLGGVVMALCCIAAHRTGYSLSPRCLSLRAVAAQVPRAVVAVSVPMLVLGGLAVEMLTATQAGGIALAHALWMGCCVVKEFRGDSFSTAVVFASLFVFAPLLLPLVLAYGLIHFPEVFAWLPALFGY
jgi:C4-dicarboxylate transporter, DctM subunit